LLILLIGEFPISNRGADLFHTVYSVRSRGPQLSASRDVWSREPPGPGALEVCKTSPNGAGSHPHDPPQKKPSERRSRKDLWRLKHSTNIRIGWAPAETLLGRKLDWDSVKESRIAGIPRRSPRRDYSSKVFAEGCGRSVARLSHRRGRRSRHLNHDIFSGAIWQCRR
jgi:hypothetical protein